jgi:hypothetical protein
VAKSLENSGVDGRILQWLFNEIGLDDMGGINVAQDREERQAVGNIVINFWIPQNMGNFSKS